jgi:hypothetical protein
VRETEDERGQTEKFRKQLFFFFLTLLSFKFLLPSIERGEQREENMEEREIGRKKEL